MSPRYTVAMRMEKKPAKLPPGGTDMVGPVKALPDRCFIFRLSSFFVVGAPSGGEDNGRRRDCCDG
jgi:hypothetical protein